jgi:hypothetical protein
MSFDNNYPEKMELEDLRGMIEELVISLFAQQKVRTLYSISEEKVRDRIELMRQRAIEKRLFF